MEYFALLLTAACFLGAVADSSSTQDNIVAFEVERAGIFEAGEQLHEEREVHSRNKRSASDKKSYIFLDNRSGKTAKVYWRDVKTSNPAEYYKSIAAGRALGLNTYENHEWSATDTLERPLLLNGQREIVQKQNTQANRSIILIKSPGQRDTDIGDRYIEVMVLVDKAAAERHRNDEEVKRYVITYLRLATSILQHKDITKLGIRLHLVLAKLVVMRRDVNDLKLDPGLRENNLRMVCRYMNKIGNSGPKRYDHKLFLTRNDFGMGGYANNRGMCSKYASCSMVYDHGFTASFLVAHELAHTFGVDDQNFGQGSGYVMSQMVDARFDVHRWSAYSQIAILSNIRKYDCIKNRPAQSSAPFVHKYPGVHYSFSRQCQLEYDKYYSAFSSRLISDDPCAKLRCRMPPPYEFLGKSSGSPALDGTECGPNKWCLSGQCTSRSGGLPVVKSEQTTVATITRRPTRPAVRESGWGEWGQWSTCSRTCSTGVQARDRRCTRPLVQNGRRFCVGTSVQVRKCDTKKACPKRVPEKDAVCAIAGRKNDARRTWKFYDDSANLDCTFETGLCAWSVDKTTGLKPWTLYKGRTPSLKTGPSFDNTLKTSKGQYIYFESSTPKRARAVLSSPLIKARQGCLQFSYHMWGDRRMGQLRLVKVSRGVSKVLWKASGNKGNRWHRHSISIQNGIPYTLSFRAKKKGSGYNSDIALDDISFKSGLCSSASSTTTREVDENPCKIKCITSDGRNPARILFPVNVYDGTTCSTKTTTGVCYQGTCKTVGCENILTDGAKGKCAGSNSRPESKTQKAVTSISATTTRSRLDCDFERSSCSWRNLPAKSRTNPRGNDLNWYRQRGQKGYYLRIRQAGPSRSVVFIASVASPEVNVARGCLTFSYRQSSVGAFARLRVKTLERYGSQEVSRTKRHLTATQTWKEEKIDFQTSRPYKVVFEATLFKGNVGITGIDNIRFTTGRCSPNKG